MLITHMPLIAVDGFGEPRATSGMCPTNGEKDMPITRSWQSDIEANVTPDERAERNAMTRYFKRYIADALDGCVSAVRLADCGTFEDAHIAMLAAHEARIGHPLSDDERSTFWMLSLAGWNERRARLRAQLRETQDNLCSPFSVFSR